ncbi:Uncharacterised protein [Mycobacteroides abscessus subsp. massiliense]|nr:Uncharacterised protein [Mycobacteroides abscessus subsp. abscessus]SIN33139.1 Uncharacterised protein [Mycobacteroides abscessus subsp. bolletii]SKF83455.1 Uncharacterised protein [Mycobacteroides abscessus subsp. massiliense]SIN58671.1 Uncharacterised protein [Mycobacteroides abscessus subsp. abscessus]SKL09791.1 Uncharacterised protein [Mycobacteroides abscessus subsp. massiliense]
MVRRCTVSAALIKPATPAAASVCPKLFFTEPITNGCARPATLPYEWPNACASSGSPTLVPVPCASIYPTNAGSIPASLITRSARRCCDTGFGTGSAIVRPS